MALIKCPECQREVSDRAVACPGCGHPLEEAGRKPGEPGRPMPFGARASGSVPYEYRSRATILGMPLVHIVYGPAWLVGFRPARGFIAIGNVAIGVIALGGFSFGILALGGISLGLFCLGGVALGIGAGLGGVATGYYALGGVAVGVYAIGGLGIGTHTLANDPHLLDSFRRLFPR
jgi:hypothetical protein